MVQAPRLPKHGGIRNEMESNAIKCSVVQRTVLAQGFTMEGAGARWGSLGGSGDFVSAVMSTLARVTVTSRYNYINIWI